jgi:hypothetical protein
MYFDRFDIVEAYYLYCRQYHKGQFSKEYALHSVFDRLQFSPGLSLRNSDDPQIALTDNGRDIFDNLVNGHSTVRDRR